MSVDTATVAKIAALARIKVSEAELEAMVPELNGILAWVEQLGEVDVTGIEPMTAVIENQLRLRTKQPLDVFQAQERWLPTFAGSMCSNVRGFLSTALTCAPALWLNA